MILEATAVYLWEVNIKNRHTDTNNAPKTYISGMDNIYCPTTTNSQQNH